MNISFEPTAHEGNAPSRRSAAIRIRRVCNLIGDCGRSSLYELVHRDPTFPRPFKLTPSATAPTLFLEDEVLEWLHARADAAKAQ
jgi:predicted DNA-binding transcriptional regulator AlpA